MNCSARGPCYIDHQMEEGEVEQEVESEKEENNTQGRRHMCMDEMKVKRQMRSALTKVKM